MGSSVILPQTGQPGPMKPGEFLSAAIPNVVSFGLDGIAPPSPLYIQRDDQLLLDVISLITGIETVTFEFRLLQAQPDVAGQPGTNPTGVVVPPGPLNTQTIKRISQVFSAATLLNNTLALPLAEGYLLSGSCTSQSATSRGQTYVSASIIRPGLAQNARVLPLFADYVTQRYRPGWPGSSLRGPSESTGAIQNVLITTPAAGADFSVTVPNPQRWRPICFHGVLTAAVAVANRQVEIILDDGANTYWIDDSSANITASSVNDVTATTTNVPTGVVTTIQNIVIPPALYMTVGHRFRSNTVGIQGADQWSALRLLVEAWLET